MRKIYTAFICALTMTLLFVSTAFAGSWKQDNVGWWWQNDDGSYPKNCWQWLDGNNDGVSECYYFDSSGYCLMNTTTPDGYKVDKYGSWVVDGKVQTQTAKTQSTAQKNVVSTNPAILPDFMEYDSSGLFSQGTSIYDNSVVFTARNSDVEYVAKEYLQMLEDMGYYLTDEVKKESRSFYKYEWYLTHDEIGGSTIRDTAQVGVNCMVVHSKDRPRVEVSIGYGDGVTYGGDIPNGTGGGDSSSASGGSSYQPDHSKLQCLTCRGSGSCGKCGGSGYVRSGSASSKSTLRGSKASCNQCHGSGRCRTCGGSGTR